MITPSALRTSTGPRPKHVRTLAPIQVVFVLQLTGNNIYDLKGFFLVRTDDNFRSKFLWGRKPMLAACAARLADKTDLVWVDLGGGTGVRTFLWRTE